MLVDGETGHEDGEVKINPGETGQAERNAQKVKSFHAEISGAHSDCHAGFRGRGYRDQKSCPRITRMARESDRGYQST